MYIYYICMQNHKCGAYIKIRIETSITNVEKKIFNNPFSKILFNKMVTANKKK